MQIIEPIVLPLQHQIMNSSKLTQKYQATVPLAIRRFLRLNSGDTIVFDIENDQVVLHKATPLDIEYARSLTNTLSEWNSQFDEEAYRDL